MELTTCSQCSLIFYESLFKLCDRAIMKGPSFMTSCKHGVFECSKFTLYIMWVIMIVQVSVQSVPCPHQTSASIGSCPHVTLNVIKTLGRLFISVSDVEWSFFFLLNIASPFKDSAHCGWFRKFLPRLEGNGGAVCSLFFFFLHIDLDHKQWLITQFDVFTFAKLPQINHMWTIRLIWLQYITMATKCFCVLNLRKPCARLQRKVSAHLTWSAQRGFRWTSFSVISVKYGE